MQEYVPFGPMSQLLGVWLAAFLTLALYSFLFKDNPFYKLAEHLFIGTSAGYYLARTIHDVIIKKGFDPLFASEVPPGETRPWILLIPMAMGLMMLFKLIPSLDWVSRTPLAFVVGAGIGIQIISYFQSNCIKQVEATLRPFAAMESLLDADPAVLASSGGWFLFCIVWFIALGVGVTMLLRHLQWARHFESTLGLAASLIVLAAFYTNSASVGGILRAFATHFGGLVNGCLLAVGVICGLFYFFFSKEHKGLVFGGCARVGIWFLMLSFGASFGYTVMGRISLLIGRIEFLLGLPEATSILLNM